MEFKYETEIYNAGFGQGITTTPIQNVKAMTPLTNDGMLLEPYLVSKIVDSSTGEIVLEKGREEIERVASTNTVVKMFQLMDDCVNGVGNTGSGYRIDSGELIGKTGTAQIANERGGGYLSGKEDIISSFSGIYPKSNPQIIIYASVKRPSGGSQKPVSNAVKDIVNNVSKYYGNTDSNSSTVEVKEYKMPNLINKKVDAARVLLDSMGIRYVFIGNGNKVINQIQKVNDTITTNEVVYLVTNDTNILVPNVNGISGKIAKDILQKIGLKVTMEGTGYVYEQSIAEGTAIGDGMEIHLKLAPKFSVEQ